MRVLQVVMAFVGIIWVAGAVPATADLDHSGYKAIRQCIECHPKADLTHKAQRPSEMKEKLPLSSQGRMLCTTCHECVTGTCVLQKSKPELCAVCHDCTQGMACMIGAAHLGDSADIRNIAVDKCLSCHGRAARLEVCMLGQETVNVMLLKSEKETLKNSAGMKAVLLDGKITCLSCHDPYLTSTAKLVSSNRDFRLCMLCHSKLEKTDHSVYEGIKACVSCHPKAPPTHKRAFPTEMKADLPLGRGERMMCTTCHDCITGTCFLRQNKPELCAVCHDCTQGMACVLNTAHLGDNSDLRGLSSKGCAQCHDNSAVTKLCSLDRDKAGDSRITCTTCHDPYSGIHAKLTRTGRRTKAMGRGPDACPRFTAVGSVDCAECHSEKTGLENE